eukprot:gene3246-2228_t
MQNSCKPNRSNYVSQQSTSNLNNKHPKHRSLTLTLSNHPSNRRITTKPHILLIEPTNTILPILPQRISYRTKCTQQISIDYRLYKPKEQGNPTIKANPCKIYRHKVNTLPTCEAHKRNQQSKVTYSLQSLKLIKSTPQSEYKQPHFSRENPILSKQPSARITIFNHVNQFTNTTKRNHQYITLKLSNTLLNGSSNPSISIQQHNVGTQQYIVQPTNPILANTLNTCLKNAQAYSYTNCKKPPTTMHSPQRILLTPNYAEIHPILTANNLIHYKATIPSRHHVSCTMSPTKHSNRKLNYNHHTPHFLQNIKTTTSTDNEENKAIIPEVHVSTLKRKESLTTQIVQNNRLTTVSKHNPPPT